MDAMETLEAKVVDAKTEMQIADALDEIRTRNARNERTAKEGGATVAGIPEKTEAELERERLEREDEEAARRAFARRPPLIEYEEDDDSEKETKAELTKPVDIPKVSSVEEQDAEKEVEESAAAREARASSDAAAMPPPPTFKRGVKRKKDFGAALGINKKAALV